MRDVNIFRLMGPFVLCGGILLVIFHKRLGESSKQRIDAVTAPDYLKTFMIKLNSPPAMLILGILMAIYGFIISVIMPTKLSK